MSHVEYDIGAIQQYDTVEFVLECFQDESCLMETCAHLDFMLDFFRVSSCGATACGVQLHKMPREEPCKKKLPRKSPNSDSRIPPCAPARCGDLCLAIYYE